MSNFIIQSLIVLFLVCKLAESQQACGTTSIYTSSSNCIGSNSVSYTGCSNLGECVQLTASNGVTFSQEYSSDGYVVYSDTMCTNYLATGAYGGCATLTVGGITYSEFNSGSVSCVDLPKDYLCERSHKNLKGYCLKITDSRNITVKATGDHLILTKKGWTLVRELKIKDQLLNGIIQDIETDYCENLNSCMTDNYQFEFQGFIFSSNSLITPHDLRKLPKLIYKLAKLWANI
jgi:hypothetical protein